MRHLRFDLVSGLTTAAVVIPQSMAYATIAGLPVQAGLYTALVPMLVYAPFGTSRTLSVGVTSTISLLTASALAGAAGGDEPARSLAAASALALLVGDFLAAASFLRLGFLANFISLPVLTGFKAGIDVVIVAGQAGKILGIAVSKGPLPRIAISILEGLGGVHLEYVRVKMVGAMPRGLPSFAPPNLSLALKLRPGAVAVTLIAFVESIAAARSFMRHGDPNPGCRSGNARSLDLLTESCAAFPREASARRQHPRQRAHVRRRQAGGRRLYEDGRQHPRVHPREPPRGGKRFFAGEAKDFRELLIEGVD
jgi:MFS superfamily sulfate permease-like transporter